MAKKMLFGEDARLAMKRGVDAVAGAVKITLGPRGRNVAIDKSYGAPIITNDGVSIAKDIDLPDKFENMGASLIKEVAEKMNKAAGDGTTTAQVLTAAIISEGMKYMRAGAQVMGIKRGIDSAVADVVEELKNSSKVIHSLEEMKQVAIVSVESPELGTLIAETIDRVGKDGVVTVEESQSSEMSSDVVEGLSFDKGYVSPYMVTDQDRMEAIMENASILITDKAIGGIKEVLPVLEKMLATGKKDLVIIADDITGEALTTFVLNRIRGVFNVVGIKAPGYGDRKKEILEDIAVMCGATVITSDKGMKLEDTDVIHLGSASKVIAKKDSTIVVGGKGNKPEIDSRVAMLKTQIENTKSTYDQEKLMERIAKLSGGVAVIRVGAATETEMKYLKLKIEDAVNATKAALEEGVVAGGGTALVQAAAKVRSGLATKKFVSNEEQLGYEIVLAACVAPLAQIAMNAGMGDGSAVITKVSEMGGLAGYNAATDTYVTDMIGEGILDPLKVTRNAIINSASSAGTFLTTEVAIAEIPEPKSTDAHAGHDHGMY
jgi:chaperonin GroEL